MDIVSMLLFHYYVILLCIVTVQSVLKSSSGEITLYVGVDLMCPMGGGKLRVFLQCHLALLVLSFNYLMSFD